MTHYSRGQLAQIAKRVRKSGATSFTGGNTKCLVCGSGFLSKSCTHTVDDNQQAIEVVKSLSFN